MMAKTGKRAGKPAAAEEKTNGATLGFETKLWQAADKMRDNPTLKGVLPKDFARPALDKQRLGELIDLIGTIGLGDRQNRSRDVRGRVYEYFLSSFASAEGKKGGQFYTPQCVVRVLVTMLDRVHRELGAADIAKIADTYHRWRGDGPDDKKAKYEDVPGFCMSATTEQIRGHQHVLTPGRYVGAEEVEDDGEPFDEKMQRLVAKLDEQFAEGSRLEKAIRKNLRGLGYGG